MNTLNELNDNGVIDSENCLYAINTEVTPGELQFIACCHYDGGCDSCTEGVKK